LTDGYGILKAARTPYPATMIDVDAIQQRFSAVSPFLDERGRRLVAAAEAATAGYGGIAAVSVATGVAASTIGRGLRELCETRDLGRVRRAGGGRKATVLKDATLLSDLGALVEPTSRGDPQSPLRWTCKSLRRLAHELQMQGHRVSHTLVGELLDDMGFSLQGNRKTREGDSHLRHCLLARGQTFRREERHEHRGSARTLPRHYSLSTIA
jgi:hypothetical protein